MKGIIMLAFTLALVTLLSVSFYMGIAHGFRFSKNTTSHSNNRNQSFFGGDKEITTKTYSLNTNGSIFIETTNGTVMVTSHEKPEVLVKIIKEGNKNDFPFVSVKTTTHPSSLSLETIYKKNSCNAAISYELVIPQSAAITTETVNGSIVVTDVTGIVKAKSTNGSLSFEQTPQLSSATTTNGRIKVNTTSITAQPNPIFLKTTNGSISFSAKTIEANKFSIKTTNGSITLSVPQELDNYYSDKNSASFSINGKASFEVETRNGSISLNRNS
jgi:hypothetical protein